MAMPTSQQLRSIPAFSTSLQLSSGELLATGDAMPAIPLFDTAKRLTRVRLKEVLVELAARTSLSRRTPTCVLTAFFQPEALLSAIRQIVEAEQLLPIVAVLPAQASLSVAVQAMRLGAWTVVEYSSAPSELADAVQAAIACDEATLSWRNELSRRRDEQAQLTGAERRVAALIATGDTNKAIAGQLDVSVRTIESRRSSIYRKLGVNTSAELTTHLATAQSVFPSLDHRSFWDAWRYAPALDHGDSAASSSAHWNLHL
ncbi:MAG: hypothetical protein KDA61_06620 [Planctomycetales bacterium]|nr:hypothetical protein [Planctomycetales bacterium]